MKKYKKIYIEITNRCNLKCSFCPPTKRKAEYMSVAKFKEVACRIKEYTDYIYLHVKGEPLMHPDFREIVETAEKMGFKINITTNGTIIDKYNDFLLENKGIRQVNISLHSHSKEEGVENVEDYLDRVLTFTKKAKELGRPYVSLRLWNLSEDENKNRKDGKNEEILQKIEETLVLDYKIEDSFMKGRGSKISENIFVNFETIFEWPDIESDQINKTGYCHGLIDHIAILVDGTVVPCCLDENGEMNLGNIYNEDFFKIINSERACKIRSGFLDRQPFEKLCKACSFKNRF